MAPATHQKANLLTILCSSQSAPVFDRLTSYFTTREVVALSLTCRQLSRLSGHLAKKRWDINSALQRFVDKPQGFREMLGKLDGQIHGGFALQFMKGVEWSESDLDICVQKDRGGELMAYLAQVESYEWAYTKAGKYNWSQVAEVHAYDRPTRDPNVRRIIEIILTQAEPVKSVLTEPFTTCLINVITWNKAFSVFPSPTFLSDQTWSLQEPDDFHDILLQKYRNRGWQDIKRVPRSEEAVVGLSVGPRRVGDLHTWVIELPTDGIVAPARSGSVEGMRFNVEHALLYGKSWTALRPEGVACPPVPHQARVSTVESDKRSLPFKW